jgi:hypothetical protein
MLSMFSANSPIGKQVPSLALLDSGGGATGITLSSYVSKTWLPYVFATNSSTSELTDIIAVATAPTFEVNGSIISVTGPFWSDTNHYLPWVIYRPIVPILSTDTVTISTTTGWATAQGPHFLPDVTLQPVLNFVGQLEIGIGKSNGVAMPNFAVTPTMRLGYNITWGGKAGPTNPYSPFRNWIHRSQLIGSITLDANFHPVSVSGQAELIVYSNVAEQGTVDSRGIPINLGTITLVVNESAPATPMSIDLGIPGSPRPSNIVKTGPVITHGPVVDGVEIGKQYQWTYNYVSNPSTYSAEIALIIFSGSGGAWTISDEQIFMPGNGVSSVYADQNVINWVTTPTGRTPDILRWVDVINNFDGVSNVIDNSDRQPITQWTWNLPHVEQNATIAISEIRNYNLTTSPVVWFEQNYPNVVAVGGGPLPYQIAPSSVGYLNDGGAGTGWYIGEVVTAAPHGLKTGQSVAFGNSGLAGLPCTNGNQSPTTVSLNGGSCEVWVTSATSFAFTEFNGFTNSIGQPGNINGIIGSNPVTATALLTVPAPGDVPVEAAAMTTASFPRTNFWLNIPGCATYDCVADIATAALNNLPGDRDLYVERSNEVWSNISWTRLDYGLGQLGVVNSTPENEAQSYVTLTGVFHNIVQAQITALGKTNKLVRVFGIQCVVGGANAIISYANTWNAANPDNPIMIDAIAAAPYFGVHVNDATITMACASVYSTDSRSIAFGTSNPFSMGQYIDLLRHVIKYNTSFNGPNGIFASINAAIATYVPCGTQPAGFVPSFIGYEGSIGQPIPSTVYTSGNAAMLTDMLHDVQYDPENINAQLAYFGMCQFGGMSTTTILSLCLPREPPNAWGYYQWAGQKPGYGLSNQFWIDDQLGHDDTNESVLGQSWLNWADVANTSPIPSTITRIAPSRVLPNTGNPGVTLTLLGFETSWTSGSSVSVQNNVTGTTTVTAGTWTAISSTLATLSVTTGAGTGTFTVTVDGVVSRAVTVGAKRKSWFGGMSRTTRAG